MRGAVAAETQTYMSSTRYCTVRWSASSVVEAAESRHSPLLQSVTASTSGMCLNMKRSRRPSGQRRVDKQICML